MRRLAAAVLAMLVTGCAGAQSGAQPPSSAPPASGSRSVPPATPSPSQQSVVLVFEADSPPSYHFTLTAGDGRLFKDFDTNAGSGSTWQGDSAALLLFGPNQTHAVLAKDGTVVLLPDSVNHAFDTTTPSGIGQGVGDPILLDSTTAIGITGYGTAQYEMIDLRSGQISTLLTVVSSQPPGRGIQPPTLVPLGTSRDRHVARVLVRHASANGTDVSGWAIAEIDLVKKSVSSIRQLPIPTGFDPFDAFEPAVSPDGRFLAYQENSGTTAQNVAIYRTDIVDLATGRTTPVVDTSIQTYGNSRGVRFSPDGTAVLVYGITAPALGPPQESRLAVFATSDGHSLASFDVGDNLHNNVSPVGWVGDQTLVYTTTTTITLGNFTNGDQFAHTLDVQSGERRDLPVGLGRLVAVLS